MDSYIRWCSWCLPVTRRVSRVFQELFAFTKHLTSPLVVREVRVTRSLCWVIITNGHEQEKFADTKEVIRSRNSKKDRQHIGQKKKDRQHNGQKKVFQELFAFTKHLTSPLVVREVRVTRSLVFYVMFCRSLFVLFRLAIVLSVLFDWWLLITPLVSSNFSIKYKLKKNKT
jgi:hypothetical protein